METDTKVLIETLLARREGLRSEEIKLDEAKTRIGKERKLIDAHLGLLGVETGKDVVVQRGNRRTGELNQQEALRVLQAADRAMTVREVFEAGDFAVKGTDGVGYTLARLTETGQIESITEPNPTGGRPSRKYAVKQVAHAA